MAAHSRVRRNKDLTGQTRHRRIFNSRSELRREIFKRVIGGWGAAVLLRRGIPVNRERGTGLGFGWGDRGGERWEAC